MPKKSNTTCNKKSRERHKSAPCLRLKISKGHETVKKLEVSNSQKEYQTQEKPKRRKWRARCPLARAPGALKRGSFRIFHHPLLQNIKILKGEKN